MTFYILTIFFLFRLFVSMKVTQLSPIICHQLLKMVISKCLSRYLKYKILIFILSSYPCLDVQDCARGKLASLKLPAIHSGEHGPVLRRVSKTGKEGVLFYFHRVYLSDTTLVRVGTYLYVFLGKYPPLLKV